MVHGNIPISFLCFYVCMLSVLSLTHTHTLFIDRRCLSNAYSFSWITHYTPALVYYIICAVSPYAVHLQGCLKKRFCVGCLWCARLGDETCLVSEEGERWCVKAKLICLWLALIKVSPRRAVNTHWLTPGVATVCVTQAVAHLFSSNAIFCNPDD